MPALRLERKAWNQRDFLEQLTEEHFVIISEINEPQYGFAWMVDAVYSDDNVAISLEELRLKLAPLGWVPNLEDDEPYILEISPIRVRNAVIGNGTQVFLWLLSFIFLTIIGAGWIGRGNSSIDSSSFEALRIGGIEYALPVMGTIALASFLRRLVANSYGVKVDHLLPISIPFPISGLSPIWPFGLIGILQLRRIDEIQFPNRISLAYVSLVLPFTLIFSGIGFISLIIPSMLSMHSSIFLVVSKIGSLSSCISFPYVIGRPFRTVIKLIKLPKILPGLALINSAASGFLFCGIILEPVVNFSGNLTKSNLSEDQITNSSASLDKCIAISDDADINSIAKSLSETASIEFSVGLLKPSLSAKKCLSIG